MNQLLITSYEKTTGRDDVNTYVIKARDFGGADELLYDRHILVKLGKLAHVIIDDTDYRGVQILDQSPRYIMFQFGEKTVAHSGNYTVIQ